MVAKQYKKQETNVAFMAPNRTLRPLLLVSILVHVLAARRTLLHALEEHGNQLCTTTGRGSLARHLR